MASIIPYPGLVYIIYNPSTILMRLGHQKATRNVHSRDAHRSLKESGAQQDVMDEMDEIDKMDDFKGPKSWILAVFLVSNHWWTRPRVEDTIRWNLAILSASVRSASGSPKDWLLGGAFEPSWKMMEFVNGKDDTPYMKWKIHENTGKKISWLARPRLRQSLCHQTTTCAHQHQTWHPTSGRKSSPDF